MIYRNKRAQGRRSRGHSVEMGFKCTAGCLEGTWNGPAHAAPELSTWQAVSQTLNKEAEAEAALGAARGCIVGSFSRAELGSDPGLWDPCAWAPSFEKEVGNHSLAAFSGLCFLRPQSQGFGLWSGTRANPNQAPALQVGRGVACPLPLLLIQLPKNNLPKSNDWGAGG